MALIDDRAESIMLMFQLETGEGRGAGCVCFPEGIVPADSPLNADERVFGIYKGTYYFTPQAILIKEGEKFRRIEWRSVQSCSTRHGDGAKIATLALTDGRTERVRVGDLAKGWSGRISQLFHLMIERYGSLITECRFEGPGHLAAASSNPSEADLDALGVSPASDTWAALLRCPWCSSSGFWIRYLGVLSPDGLICDQQSQLQRSEIVCRSCGGSACLFDASRHGYDAQIAADSAAEPPERRCERSYKCTCGGTLFSVCCAAQYDTDPEELAETDRDKWGDSFGWFVAVFRCNQCGKTVKAIDYECA